LRFIVHPVGRGILDAPVNLHGKFTLPTTIIALISFANWEKMILFSAARQGCRTLRMEGIGTVNENLKEWAKENSGTGVPEFF
jgi:hypothetical protein